MRIGCMASTNLKQQKQQPQWSVGLMNLWIAWTHLRIGWATKVHGQPINKSHCRRGSICLPPCVARSALHIWRHCDAALQTRRIWGREWRQKGESKQYTCLWHTWLRHSKTVMWSGIPFEEKTGADCWCTHSRFPWVSLRKFFQWVATFRNSAIYDLYQQTFNLASYRGANQHND